MTDEDPPGEGADPMASEHIAVTVHLSERGKFADDDEPDRFVHLIDGAIVIIDEDGHDIPIGKIQAFFVDVGGACLEGEPLFEVFDCNGLTFEYYKEMFAGEELKRRVALAMDFEPLCPNILILDELTIYPAFRGKRLGLCAVRALLSRYLSSVGIVVTWPHALQHSASVKPTSDDYHNLGLYEFTKGRTASLKAVRRYLERIGFFRIGRSRVMFLDPRLLLPKASELRGEPHDERAMRMRPAPPERPLAKVYPFVRSEQQSND